MRPPPLPPPPAATPGPVPSPPSGAPRGRSWAIIAVAAGVIVVAGLAAGWWLSREDNPSSTAVTLESLDSPGWSPFVDSVAEEVPISSQARERFGSFGLSGTVSADAAGLYGGTGEESAACDAGLLEDYLAEHDAKRTAWAEVVGIAAEEVGDYLQTLTALVLTHDTAVTNHGYADGQATAFPAVLQAGTAVLVDRQGTPVVRCACGNPLAAPDDDVDLSHTSGQAWDGYEPTEVVGIVGASQPLTQLDIVDVDSGKQLVLGIGEEPMLAWSGGFEPRTGALAFVWNGETVVEVAAPDDPDDAPADVLMPAGFLGDIVIMQTVAGAHGHTTELLAVDTFDGSILSRLSCAGCDTVAVTDGAVVTVEAYTLLGHRWDPRSDEHETFDLPAGQIAQPDPEFGDPYPYARVLVADGENVYLSADHVDDDPGTAAQQRPEHQRLLRISGDEAVWSEPLGIQGAPGAAALSPDGTAVALVLAEGPSVAWLDAETLELADSLALPTKVAGDPDPMTDIWALQTRLGNDGSVSVIVNTCAGPDCTGDNAVLNVEGPDGEWSGEDTPMACEDPTGTIRGLVIGGYPGAGYTITVSRLQDGEFTDVSMPYPASGTCLTSR